jgi:hypothetical protein
MAMHPQFSPLSFEQANPLLAGLMQGQKFGQSMQRFPLEQEQMKLINAIKQVEAQYAPEMAKGNLLKLNQENQYNPRLWESQIGYQGAQTNRMNTMTPLEAKELDLKNQNYNDLIKAQIENYRALSNQRNSGVTGLGTGGKEELMFQQYVGRDNPQLGNDPNKIYEASNVLRQGGTHLQDGTPLNPLSPAAKSTLDRLVKSGTTTTLVTQGVQAAQAEAELPVFKKAIDEGIEPYGTTIFNTSPQQIKDAINVKDHTAQARLGKYLAAQQLLYDRAALTLKVNALPPGVNIANEIRNLSYASVNEKFPRMSSEARKIASDIVFSVLKDALEARRSVDTGAASLQNINKNISKNLEKNLDLSSLSDEELRKIAGGG